MMRRRGEVFVLLFPAEGYNLIIQLTEKPTGKGYAMTFFILAFVIGSILLFVTAWVSYKRHMAVHNIDLMAGDEGED